MAKNIHQMRIFGQYLKLSYTKASKILGLAQLSLSQQIKLEEN